MKTRDSDPGFPVDLNIPLMVPIAAILASAVTTRNFNLSILHLPSFNLQSPSPTPPLNLNSGLRVQRGRTNSGPRPVPGSNHARHQRVVTPGDFYN